MGREGWCLEVRERGGMVFGEGEEVREREGMVFGEGEEGKGERRDVWGGRGG